MSSIQTTILGKSALGNPIEVFKKIHTSSTQRPFLFIGGVHGDEPEGVEMAQKLLLWLTETEKQRPLRSWILIPCINPDGYKKNERTNGHGTDLNRNFPSHDWSGENTRGARYSPGPRPASEPEVKAIQNYYNVKKLNMVLDMHSYGEMFFWPVGYSDKDVPEAALFKA